MGVSICTVCKGERRKWSNFQYDSESHTSDEEEDTGNYKGSLNLLKYISLPSGGNFDKVSRKKRAISERKRSRGYSLQEKIEHWQRSEEVNKEAEFHAEQHSKVITDDTLKNLGKTLRTADSIVGKSLSIRDELARQSRVLSQGESDVSAIEDDIAQTSATLTAMSSIVTKPRISILKKDMKCKEDEGLHIPCKPTLKSLSLSGSSADDMQQTLISAGIGQLDMAMDTIASHQIDIAYELTTQEERFTRFENRLTNAEEKIKSQSHTMKKVMKKF